MYLSPKFGVNLLDGFRENDVYGRPTDTRVMTVALYCAIAQCRAKNYDWDFEIPTFSIFIIEK